MSAAAAAAAPSLRHATRDTECRPARPGNIAVYKSSRARPNKNQHGWGNLPEDLIHTILALVYEDSPLDPALHIKPDGVAIANALASRHWLCQMRLISSGWCAAVDSHPFWAQYLEAFRPDIAHVADPSPRRDRFATARAATAAVCAICRLCSPSNLTRSVSTLWTAKLGYVPVCQVHCSWLCTHCMRVQTTDGENLNIRFCARGDRDETGHLRRSQIVCVSCRASAFDAAITQELREVSRGEFSGGQSFDWRSTMAFIEYVYYGSGRSDSAAKYAVEEVFLTQHCGWAQLEVFFRELQMLLLELKTKYYHSRMGPNQHEGQNIQQLVACIWGDDDPDDCISLQSCYQEWTNEIDNGHYTEEHWQLDIERLRLPFNHVMHRRFWPSLRQKLARRSVSTWVSARVANGLWVLPSDEIEQYLYPEREIHTSIAKLMKEVINPVNPDNTHVDTGGSFRLPPLADLATSDKFLPPDRILQIMNAMFEDTLSSRLQLPMREFVEAQRHDLGDDDAEQFCETVVTPELLSVMQKEAAWHEEGLLYGPMRRRAKPVATDAGGSTIMSDEYDLDGEDGVGDAVEVPVEPRIELVEATEPLGDPGFIREGWSEAEDESDAGSIRSRSSIAHLEVASSTSVTSSTLSASLGKRKSLDGLEDGDTEHAPRRRLSSGHSSEHTALITPDESPSLLPEVQLASETENDAPTTILVPAEDAQVTPTVSPRAAKKSPEEETVVPPSEAAPEAVDVTPTTPTTSPKLGKRKSPEDDDLVQPKRSPASPLTAKSAPEAAVEPIVISDDEDSESTTSLHSVQPIQKPRGLAERVAPPARSPSPIDSMASSTWSEAEMDAIPFVPPPWAKLGPGATGIIETAWERALEPLRECRCGVCVRGAQRNYLGSVIMSVIEGR